MWFACWLAILARSHGSHASLARTLSKLVVKRGMVSWIQGIWYLQRPVDISTLIIVFIFGAKIFKQLLFWILLCFRLGHPFFFLLFTVQCVSRYRVGRSDWGKKLLEITRRLQNRRAGTPVWFIALETGKNKTWTKAIWRKSRWMSLSKLAMRMTSKVNIYIFAWTKYTIFYKNVPVFSILLLCLFLKEQC